MEAFTGFHRFADCIEGDLQRGCVRFEVMDVDSYRDALACLRLPKNVPVIRLEDAAMAEQICEYVLHAVLHHYREFDIYAAAQEGKGLWAPRPPRRKAGYRVGILGYGVLGRAVAQWLTSAGFDVVAWARTPRADAPIRIHSGAAYHKFN